MKTYLLCFVLIAIALAVPTVAIVALGMIGGESEREQSDAEIRRQRRAAEEKRWAALTDAQKALELDARRKAEEQKKAEQLAAAAAVQREQDFALARGACLISVENVLNDPFSAKFERTTTWYTEEEKPGVFLVQPKVRAKNAFGAYIYSTWNCRIRREGENMRLLQLSVL